MAFNGEGRPLTVYKSLELTYTASDFIQQKDIDRAGMAHTVYIMTIVLQAF
jgi:hypothetical protein